MEEKDKAEKADFLDSWTAEETPPSEKKEEAQQEAPTAKTSEKTEPDAPPETATAEPDPSKPKFPPKEGKEPLTEKEVVALIEMRRKADEAERKAADLERRLQFHEQQQQRAAEKEPPPPDQLDEPEKYQAWQDARLQQALLNERMNTSEIVARQQAGDQAVDAAIEAIKALQDEGVKRRITNARHPYGELLKWHKEHFDLAELRAAGSLEALIEKRIAERAKAPPAVQSPQATPAKTPPSLAKSGVGGAKPSSNDRETDAEFFSSVFR